MFELPIDGHLLSLLMRCYVFVFVFLSICLSMSISVITWYVCTYRDSIKTWKIHTLLYYSAIKRVKYLYIIQQELTLKMLCSVKEDALSNLLF